MLMICSSVGLELLPQILNTGLKEDRMSTVNLILSTLKTRVSTSDLTFKVKSLDYELCVEIFVCGWLDCVKQSHQ